MRINIKNRGSSQMMDYLLSNLDLLQLLVFNNYFHLEEHLLFVLAAACFSLFICFGKKKKIIHLFFLIIIGIWVKKQNNDWTFEYSSSSLGPKNYKLPTKVEMGFLH